MDAKRSSSRNFRRTKCQSGLPIRVRRQHDRPPNFAYVLGCLLDRETAIRNARRIDVTIGTLHSQFDTYTEGMYAQDPSLNRTSNQLISHLPPLGQR